MGALRRRLGKLEQEAARSIEELEQAWSNQACSRLTDAELELLDNALRREADAGLGDDVEFPHLPLGPDEEAAYRRWLRFFEEARRGA